MNIQDLKNYAKEKTLYLPALQEDFKDFVQLALDEIESGESEDHEIQLAIQSIDDLINEYLNNK